MKNIYTKLRLIISVICFSLFVNHASTQDTNLSSDKLFQAYKYRNVGPTRGGRVTTVEGVVALPGTFYMGSTGGGVWKTEDYGITWKNISDGYFNTPSIGAIRVVSSNPDIIYVGTGSDGIRSNVITGKGVYKSSDGGKTWDHIGLKEVGQIGAVEIHPDKSETVFVAAIGQVFQPNKERGVYRSQDGGKTWENVLYLSDTIGAADLEFAPGNPDIIYASMWRAERKPWTIISGGQQAGGIFKSKDGGSTWTKLKKGLPEGLIGKIDLAVSPADPNRLYALIEAPKGEGGIYRSNDQGETFELVSTRKELINRPFYYCNIETNPLNADVVFSNANRFMKSNDGGKTWKILSTPHGDNHDIWINPTDTLEWIQSNDGGVNITTNGGKTWSTQRNQPTAELYQVEVDDQYPYWLYAGQQDNSTITVPGLPPNNRIAGVTSYWLAVGGCETGPAVPKTGNPDIVYSNCKGRFGVFDKRTGQERQYYVGAGNIYGHNPKDLKFRFQRVSPIHISPHNPSVVYHASQYLHKTTNEGINWETISPDLTAFEPEKQVISGSPITRDITGEEFYSTIYSVRESTIKEGLIWTGANDGPVHVTLDGGSNWNNVTPKELPSGGRVDCVEPSSHKEGKAYIAVLRYQLGDWHPYIYKTEDYGKQWTLLTDGNNGIPADYPTRVVREDPDKEGLLYAGTEFGLFVSHDDGVTWKSFQQNLPVTPVTDINIHRKDLILSTMGRSFWIMDNLSSLQQISKLSNDTEALLFRPEDTYRFRYRGNSKNNVPYYPGPSVIIDYYLKDSLNDDIKLEILTSDHKVLRTFVSLSKSKDGEKAETENMATGSRRDNSSASISKNEGLNRFRWNMRHRGSWDKDTVKSGQNGPMVAPGQYEIRLTVGNKSYMQSFNLLKDPKLENTDISLDDIKAQEKLTLQIRDLQDTSRQVAAKIESRRKELAELGKDGKVPKKYAKEDKQLVGFEQELVTSEGIYMTPMLIDQLNYLASMLNRADQRPGKDAYDRYQELESKLYKLLADYNAFKTDVTGSED